MKIHKPGIYHIYNRGNNQQPVFFREANYLYFLQKCQKYIKPFGEIFAWCLMPNHFHFLININRESLNPVHSGSIIMPAITNGFRLLQSSYAKGINIQEGRTGNLFQQKTRAKFVSDSEDYPRTAFFYIHQNPVEAGLVQKAEDWPYSSFRDYTGLRSGTLCCKEICVQKLDLASIDLRTEAVRKIEEDMIKHIL